MLLDTNVIIRLVREPQMLPLPIREKLADPETYRATSIITFWEMTIKHRKGKLPLPATFTTDPDEAFANWCERAVIDIIPLSARHVARAMRLDFAHEDPFDRAIAATALVENMPLVTSDIAFAACPGLRVVKV